MQAVVLFGRGGRTRTRNHRFWRKNLKASVSTTLVKTQNMRCKNKEAKRLFLLGMRIHILLTKFTIYEKKYTSDLNFYCTVRFAYQWMKPESTLAEIT